MPTFLIIKSKLINIIEFMLPNRFHLPLRYLFRKFKDSLDPEMIYVENILKKKRCFVDIGSNIGIYSYYFLNKFDEIISFEPLIKSSNKLKSLKSKKITIHNIALSDTSGENILYTPIKKGVMVPSNSSLNKIGLDYEENLIKIKTLDKFNLIEVDLIKIDVEGHEDKVLSGALDTIKRNRPVLIIEIEQRHIHRPINEVFEMITNLNYKGFFLKKKKLLSIKDFSLNIDQKKFLKNNVPMKGYINNFIFLPNEN